MWKNNKFVLNNDNNIDEHFRSSDWSQSKEDWRCTLGDKKKNWTTIERNGIREIFAWDETLVRLCTNRGYTSGNIEDTPFAYIKSFTRNIDSDKKNPCWVYTLQSKMFWNFTLKFLFSFELYIIFQLYIYVS